VIFSQTVEYALRSVVWLAAHADSPQTVHEIAEATHIPANYLAKVMNSLRRTGLVESRRGLGGGYILARSVNELTVLDVVNTVDPIRRIRQCPLGLKPQGPGLCPLHKRLDEAIGLIETAFTKTKITDLVVGPDGPGSICGGASCKGPGGAS
jgi:Rrf2 family transcriptional regulator, nitric oxide-sensitive transcriptional repressor